MGANGSEPLLRSIRKPVSLSLLSIQSSRTLANSWRVAARPVGAAGVSGLETATFPSISVAFSAMEAGRVLSTRRTVMETGLVVPGVNEGMVMVALFELVTTIGETR